MKFKLFVTISLILLQRTQSACGEGTLQCNSSNQSVICDATNSYKLNSETNECEKKTVEGCQIPSYSTSTSPCAQCKPGKVFDTGSTKCVDVSEEKKKPNCLNYDNDDSSCKSCDSDFYLNGTSCSAVGEVKVTNCAMYSSETDCSVCDENFYLKDNTCKEIKLVNGCQTHSNRKCDSCVSEYTLNRAYETQKSVTSADLGLMTLGYPQWSGTSNSGSVCQKETVTNCISPETFDKCLSCKVNYFLNDEKKCERNPESVIADCKVYSNATTCTECKENFYMDEGACPRVTEVPDCLTYSSESNACYSCKKEKFLSSGECKPRVANPSDCKTLNRTDDECSVCNDGFLLTIDKKTCFAKVSNCEINDEAASATNEKHKCSECKLNYFSDDSGVSCKQKSVEGCLEYTASFTENKCLTCPSLKLPNPDKTSCVDLSTPTGCLTSNGQDEVCQSCMPGHFKSGSPETCSSTKTQTNTDGNCKENNGTEDQTTCTVCKDNFILATSSAMTSVTINTMEEKKCKLIYREQPDKCQQCINNYILQDEGTCLENQINDNSKMCDLKKPDSKTALTENSDCLVCDPAQPLHIYGGFKQCRYALNYSSLLNCATWDPDYPNTYNPTCTACQEGYRFVKEDIVTCSSDLYGRNFFHTLVENCLVYNEDGKCNVCIKGKKPLSNGRSCIDHTASSVVLERTFDVNFHPMGSIELASEVSNCATYIQIDETTIACKKCDANYTGIIAYLIDGALSSNSSTVESNYILTPSGVKSSGPAFWNKIYECIPKAKSAKNADDVSSDMQKYCSLGYKVGDDFICQRCNDETFGTVHKFTKTSTGSALAANNQINGILECELMGDDLSAFISGVGYQNRMDTSALQWNNYFNFEFCKNDKTVVYYGTMTGLEFVYHETTVDTDVKPKQLYCILDTHFNGNLIDNCQAYSFAAKPANNSFKPSSLGVGGFSTQLQCLSCKPGYAAGETNSIISTCTLIENCKFGEAFNQWSNSCKTPTTSWTMTFANDYFMVDFHRTSSTSIQFCQIIYDSKCYMCMLGIQLSEDRLSCITTVTAEDLNCGSGTNEKGMGYTNLTTSNTVPNSNLQLMTGIIIRYNQPGLSNYNSHVNATCGVCADGFNAVKNTSTTYLGYKCGKVFSAGPMATSIPNCERDNIDNGVNKCLFCASTHIVNKNDGSCVLKSDFPNCKNVYLDDTTLKCSTCEDGFLLKSSDNTCFADNCDEIDQLYESGKCLICSGSNVPNTDDFKSCIANDKENDPCLKYSPYLNHCVKCVDDTKIPHIFREDAVIKGFECVTVDLSSPTYRGYNAGFPYIQSNSTDNSTELKIVFNYSQGMRVANLDSAELPAVNYCFPERTIDNCKTLVNNVFCSACNDTYYLMTSNNTCASGAVDNCAVYPDNDAATCTTCVSGHYMPNSTTCTAYTANLNCGTFNSTEDACLTCASGFWKDISDGVKCREPTDSQCATVNATADHCDSCNAQYWLDTANSNACVANSVIENCTSYSNTVDNCATCEEGHYHAVEAKECRLFPDGIGACVEYDDRVTCSACASTHFLKNKICEAVTDSVEHCSKFSSATECSACKNNYILKGNACVLVTAENCVEFVDETKCKNCIPNYLLDSDNGTCTDSGINNCIDPVKGTPNTCNQCSKGTLLSENKTSCDAPNPLLAGCADYETAEKCKLCSTGYILAVDGSECTTLSNSAGANCGTASFVEDPICDMCMIGYKKNADGQCQALENAECAFMDLATNKCLICSPGNYMDKDGACTKPTTTPAPCTGDDCGVSISQSFIILAFLTVFLNKLF